MSHPSFAPTPFTAAQIRENNPPGAWRVFQIELADGGDPIHRRTRYLDGPNEATARCESAMLDEDGAVQGEVELREVTWEALRLHAQYPDDATTITDGVEIEVPAGTFTCRLYTVTGTNDDGQTEVVRAWFSLADPGPPVRHEVEVEGTLALRLELFASGRD